VVSAKVMAAVTRLGSAAVGLALVSVAIQAHSATPAAKPAAAAPAASATAGKQPETPAAAASTGAAAAPAGGATATAAVDPAKGRELFNNWGCNSCHSLADAGASGHVGPALDGNPNLTKALVVDRVTNGQGPMPAFGGQMTDEEIATVATYVAQVAKK
jgi:mono/diheme cytochrome c family protein